jgi:hypothetical protein
LQRCAVRIINWLALKKWPERGWRWIPWLLLRLYAVLVLIVALYLLLYQLTHGGFIDRPFQP